MGVPSPDWRSTRGRRRLTTIDALRHLAMTNTHVVSSSRLKLTTKSPHIYGVEGVGGFIRLRHPCLYSGGPRGGSSISNGVNSSVRGRSTVLGRVGIREGGGPHRVSVTDQ